MLSYDAKVADYWPEFAQAGKSEVTVRQLLAHQAGLSALTPAPTLRDVDDPSRLAPILAAQAPAWRPGARHGYHAITLGWYQSELIRRTDPAGRTVGRFLADEVATPLGLDLHVGLPDHIDRERLAHLHIWKRAELLLHLNVVPPGVVAMSLNPVGLTARSTAIPRDVKGDDYNRDDVRAVEMPSSNGIGTANSVAKLYGSAASGGAELGLTKTTLDALAAPAIPPTGGVRDKILNVDAAFSLGFCKPLPKVQFGSSDKAFGTPGWGGSFGFADPDTGVGFAYVMNRLGFHVASDPRELALRQAVFRDVLGARPQS